MGKKAEYDEAWALRHARDSTVRMTVGFAVKQVKEMKGVKRLLDVGCGSGVLVDKLNRRGYKAEGLDSSLANVEYAFRQMKGVFYRGDIQGDLPVALSSEYDLIVATHIVEHLEQPLKAILRLRGLLREGGYLYIAVPNLAAYNKKSIWRRQLAVNIYFPDHIQFYTPESLYELIIKGGFAPFRLFTKTYAYEIPLYYVIGFYRKLFTKTGCELETLQKPVGRPIIRKLCEKIAYSPLRCLFALSASLSQKNLRGAELIIIARKRDG